MPATIDLSGIRSAAALLRGAPAQAEKAVQRARSTLARRLPVEARRDIQQEYAVPARRVAAGLKTRQVAEGVEITGLKRGIGLINFNLSGGLRRRPVKAAVRRGEALEERPGAFVARAPNGAKQVFVRAEFRFRSYGGAGNSRNDNFRVGRPEKRETTIGRYAGTGIKREPLDVLYGPSVAQMLGRPERRERLGVAAQTILSTEIARLFR